MQPFAPLALTRPIPMKLRRSSAAPPPGFYLLCWGLLGCVYCCLVPDFRYGHSEVRQWLAPPTPTPVALPLALDPAAEAAAPDLVYSWLQEHHGLHATLDPDLATQAYYLAGEAPRFRFRSGPEWPGLRYAVGPANGQWLRYWPGGDTCSSPTMPRAAFATGSFPGLAEAERVGVAVVWRAEQPYLAVVWPGWCPPAAPAPAPAYSGPTGPSW